MPLIAESIPASGNLAIYHSGPPLSMGPLPTLFYFALSGKDSIELAPYNQPVAFLKQERLRVFSFTIPGHGPGLKNSDALHYWAQSFAKGENPIEAFLDEALKNIEFLIQSKIVDPLKMGVAGLSRGAFLATHLVAKEPRIAHLLGFAPLTRLDLSSEFQSYPPIENVNLEVLIPKLIHKNVRFYIGNLDTRVHTEECFRFIHKLTQFASKERSRNLAFELNVVPSIGHHGHGTSPETFLDGVNWLKKQLALSS